MKVSGFTIVRNGVRLKYPFEASIKSLLPLVDELIVSVGQSDDNTRQVVQNIKDSKIKIVDSVWDEQLREGGRVLAEETNKAHAQVATDADWLVYLQADEVLHEKDIPVIREAMQQNLTNLNVEGLLLSYIHFFGHYKYVADGIKWYDKEIRIIRNNPQILSYQDAQGFRMANGNKLRVKEVKACVYHYGWVKHPADMLQKHIAIGQYWRSTSEYESWQKEIQQAYQNDSIFQSIDSLKLFEGNHPEVMHTNIAAADWSLELDISKKNFKNYKYHLYYWMKQKFGWRPFARYNYRLIGN